MGTAGEDDPALGAWTKADLRAHVDDLRGLLPDGSVFERKGFFRSFVKRITVTYGRGTIAYTYPTGSDGGGDGSGVLSSAKKSSPGRT